MHPGQQVVQHGRHGVEVTRDVQLGLSEVAVATLQALSGAGYPGVASMDIADNVIPYIGGGEEEKIETETNKILGRLKDGVVENHPLTISAAVTRVPVLST